MGESINEKEYQLKELNEQMQMINRYFHNLVPEETGIHEIDRMITLLERARNEMSSIS